MPLQVRMKNETIAELKKTADELGTTQVGLVKLCVVAFLRWVAENKIRRLPDDWAQVIDEMDGRKTRYRGTGTLNALKVAEQNGGTYGANKPRRKRT